MSFYGLTPKYLQLWSNTSEKGENDSSKKPFTESDRNTMHPALVSAPEVSLFMNNFHRYIEFNKNTIFLEEMDREKGIEGHGDTVYFSSENFDGSMVDIMSRFCLVFESDVDICSLEDIFGNIYVSLYSDDESKQRSLDSFRKETKKVPIVSRHAQILRTDAPLDCLNFTIYGRVQERLVFDFHNDLEDITKPRLATNTFTRGKEVTVSMSSSLHQCICDLMATPSYFKIQRGNKYYVNVPLVLFFTCEMMQRISLLYLRKKFEFQLRLDCVKVPKMRLMLNVIQLTEDEHYAILTRENEQLSQVHYDVFHELCETGYLKKSWKTSMAYTILNFILQVCDSETGERLACNLKGSFKIKDQVFPFNIHTNQASQKNVFGLKNYNPFVWVVPFTLRAGHQPQGCLFTTADTDMSVEIDCDVKNVTIDCWMTCYRVFCQKFIPNQIGFMHDVGVLHPQVKEHLPVFQPHQSQSSISSSQPLRDNTDRNDVCLAMTDEEVLEWMRQNQVRDESGNQI